jgi:hypothetical protein
MTIAGSVNATKGVTIGGTGIKVSNLLYGRGEVFAPSFGATAGASGGAPGSCQMTVANATCTMMCIAIPASMPGGLHLVSASCQTGYIDLDFESAACTSVAAAWLTINYLLIS